MIPWIDSRNSLVTPIDLRQPTQITATFCCNFVIATSIVRLQSGRMIGNVGSRGFTTQCYRGVPIGKQEPAKRALFAPIPASTNIRAIRSGDSGNGHLLIQSDDACRIAQCGDTWR